jgi:hypothetical protein
MIPLHTTHVYLQCHVTSGYATPDWLSALLWALLPWLHVPPLPNSNTLIAISAPMSSGMYKAPMPDLTLACVPQEACP